jgi:hypothetical protein
LAVGYLWNRRNRMRLERARPFVAVFTKHAHESVCSLELCTFKDAPLEFAYVSAVPGGERVFRHAQKLAEKSKSQDLRNCETLIVDTIRNVARKSSTVGPNVMSIVMSPPKYRQIRIRFHPCDSHELGPRLWCDSSQEYMNTPWIIGPIGARPPSTIYGETSVISLPVGGHYEFQVDSPPSRPNWPRIAIGPQFRRRM